MSPEDLEAMLRAYEEGGDRGLRDWMEGYLGNNYVAGWEGVPDHGAASGVGPPGE